MENTPGNILVLDGAVGLRRLPDEWLSGPRAGRGTFAVLGEARQVQVPLIDLSSASDQRDTVATSLH